MADLDNFFAKKDKKKKKPKGTARPATDAGVVGGSSSEGGASASGLSTAPKASKGDDGWIEIEDPKTAQVNTGGRTVGDFKRDADGKDGNGDGTTSGDKFSGWTKTADEDGEGEGESKLFSGSRRRDLFGALFLRVRRLGYRGSYDDDVGKARSVSYTSGEHSANSQWRHLLSTLMCIHVVI